MGTHLQGITDWYNTLNYQVAGEFASSSDAQQLQVHLEKRAQMEDNWLFDWWLSMYLDYRIPVVIHSNPAMRMRPISFRTDAAWLDYVTSIISAMLSYKAKLESRGISTEFFPDGSAMCMAQHYTAMGNCRIPGTPNDRILSRRGGPYTTRPIRHICVLYRNRVFVLDYFDSVARAQADPTTLRLQLEHIVSTCQGEPEGPPVGLLTSLPRDEWSRVHAVLRQDLPNANLLSYLETSLFILCLDDSAQLPDAPSPSKSTEPLQLGGPEAVSADHLLHGSMINSGNRWFDKSIQFICSRDGSIGLNFEHTAADAGAMVPIVEEVYSWADMPITGSSIRLPVYAQPKELKWQLHGEMATEVHQAGDALKELIDSLETEYGLFQQFGSDGVKKFKVSPDAFVQMALQLAYSRVHPDRLPPATYESGSLRRFYLGRTDTIRSCSQESEQFARAMSDSITTPADRAKLLRKALERHQTYTQELLSGDAFDRHLLGLRLIAQSLNRLGDAPVQTLFSDPTYTEANAYRLSTSQIRSPNHLSVVYGPVIPNGYAFCYNIRKDSIQMTSASFRPSTETQPPAVLLQAVSQALCDLSDLLDQ